MLHPQLFPGACRKPQAGTFAVQSENRGEGRLGMSQEPRQGVERPHLGTRAVGPS